MVSGAGNKLRDHQLDWIGFARNGLGEISAALAKEAMA
jgi:hypothetical protein